ncbi:MAG TPA: hypothetical protein VND65_08595 [Candidatus Binatia bacterium]|nr:hypothetical protein [Candidatus Binatia bacterium]
MAYESELEAELEDEFEAELEDESEDEMEDEMEDEAGLEGEGWLGAIGNIASSLLGETEGEYEDEAEAEDEFEDEDELNPVRKIYPDAMMEHLGELATEAESEDEAARHLAPVAHMAAGKVLPVAAMAIHPAAKKAIPKIARAVHKATPHLTKAVAKVAKVLHRNPQTRHLLRAVPGIARRAVGQIARQAARGARVSPRVAVRTLARQARRVLGSPRLRAHALRRHNNLERRFHYRWGRGAAHPQFRYGRGGRYWRYGRGRRYRGAVPRYTATGGVVPGRVATTVARPGAVVPARGVRYGQVAGGQCTCAPCPACGGAPGTQAAPAPAYCRCCGQVIR